MAPLAIFRNRASAGRQLASRLAREPFTDPVVLALPRGGVPVGYEVAKALNAPLDLLLVRKIGVPGQSELAAGAVVDGQNPDLVLNDHVIGVAGLDASPIRMLAALELEEVERRRRTYLPGHAPVPVIGRSAVVVDDGIATGASMRAALTALRRRQPRDLTLAVPVAPPETVAELRPLADRIVCLVIPDEFGSVGVFYDDFHQLTDAEVTGLMARAAAFGAARANTSSL